MAARVDVAIVGGGIVGLATGLKLLERAPGLSVVILEKEKEVAAHQTGHNSGVIHSGLYYKPGSEKAKTCVEGRRLLVEFCRRHDIPHDICGKLVVATSESELPALASLERRAGENGLMGVRTLAPAEFRRVEPHAAGIRALHVPDTGIVD
ncbi:MAG TPA: FAD-dependent oxidoreductase, partial [Thermoanaerobaculia bacterium]|nr:FAD-dependent oxidoreductase [Thermoanaerobaculia bacterium]